MMLRTIRTCVFGIALLLFATPLCAQPGSWAEGLFEKLDHDFGVVARDADTKHRIKLVNKYPDPVHIVGAGTLCKCMTARALQDTIAPGETGYIEVTLDTKKYEGNRDTTVIVHFDRPQYAEVRIPVKAYIRKDVMLTPGKVDFGPIDRGTSAERRIALAYSGRPDWTIRDIITKNKHIEVKWNETSRAGGMCSYDLVATLKPGAPAGEIRDQLTIVTDDQGNPQIPVLVEGRVETEFTVGTELVDFGALTPGTRKSINVVIRGRKPFTVEKIESETTAGTFEVRLPREPRTIQVLPLTVIAPNEPGTLREEFTVTISGAAEPVTFKAQCKVVPSTAARP